MAENLATALAAFQAEAPRIGKDNTANAGTYSYKYADLADINAVVLPLLGKHGLSFSAKPTIVDNRFVLAYTLRHSSGGEDSGIYPLPDPTKVSAQQIGSAISYARRYTFCAVTGIAPGGEDDDGAAAVPASRERVQQDWEDAAPVNAADDMALREAYERDLATATEEEIQKIGKGVKAQLANHEISKRTHDYLGRKAAERLAELATAASGPEPATVPPASDTPPSRRQQQLDRMTARVEQKKAATDAAG